MLGLEIWGGYIGIERRGRESRGAEGAYRGVWESVVSSLSGVWGEAQAPAANGFLYLYRQFKHVQMAYGINVWTLMTAKN